MNDCPSSEVLLDLLLDLEDSEARQRAHVAGCSACSRELESMRALVSSLQWAMTEPMPEPWAEAVLAQVEAEAKHEEKASVPVLVAESLPTLGLASITVLACVALFVPGGELGHPLGLLVYSVSAGAVAAAWEVMQTLKGKELRSI